MLRHFAFAFALVGCGSAPDQPFGATRAPGGATSDVDASSTGGSGGASSTTNGAGGAVIGGCDRDTDCKGARICVARTCVEQDSGVHHGSGGAADAAVSAGGTGSKGTGGSQTKGGSGGDVPADSGADAIAGCTPLSCTDPDGNLRCGTLTDACGHRLECGVTCGGLGTCGTTKDAHACTCGACGQCGAGEKWYQNRCCILNTCETNSITGSGPLCGDVNDNCGGMIHCGSTCPAGGTCGAQGISHLCSCWLADNEASYPCTGGLHNYDCEGGSQVLQPTIGGCVKNATDSTGTRWCCP